MQPMMGKLWIGAILVASTSSIVAQSRGETTYNAQCQVCHGTTGTVDTPAGRALQARAMSDPRVVNASDTTLLVFIKGGSGKMPPFKDRLTDGEIKDVIAYIRILEKRR